MTFENGDDDSNLYSRDELISCVGSKKRKIDRS